MINNKMLSMSLLLCFVSLSEISLAVPVKMVPNPSDRLLQALTNQHSSSKSVGKAHSLDPSDRSSLLLRDLMYLQKAYPLPSDNNEASEVQFKESEKYSPLEYLQTFVGQDYDGNNDYYQDQVNPEEFYTDRGWFDRPVLPNVGEDEQLDRLLTNYYLSKLSENENDDEDDSNVQKRRQKIVIKEDYPELTTASTPVSSTPGQRKIKLGHKPVKSLHHGQKEVALLRPAENKQKEWPSELDENNLEEEESLKELPLRAQSRPVRDVLTSQLDGLKREAQLKTGAKRSEQTSKPSKM